MRVRYNRVSDNRARQFLSYIAARNIKLVDATNEVIITAEGHPETETREVTAYLQEQGLVEATKKNLEGKHFRVTPKGWDFLGLPAPLWIGC